MRDLLLIFIFSGMAFLVWRRAWLGVLALAFVGYGHPQGYADGLVSILPLYKLFFLLTFIGVLQERQWLSKDWLIQQTSWIKDWRVAFIILFWLYTAFTSSQSLIPGHAWPKWIEFTATLAGLFFTLILIDTRKKLFWLTVVIALSFSLVALKGGFWAILHGAADRVYGPPNSHFYDNNHFAIAALMAIPLLLVWFHESTAKSHRIVITALVLFSLVATLSSWSRGALLAIIGTALWLAWQQKQRLLLFALISFFSMSTFFLMPQDWLDRMETISTYQKEGSALGRLEVWQMGIEQALNRPIQGWGFNSWVVITNNLRDWHSAYVESFTEHGLPGFIFWFGLLFGNIVSLGVLIWRNRVIPNSLWKIHYARNYQASLVAYAIGAAFLGITYWDIFYHLLIMSAVLSRINGIDLAGKTGKTTVR